MSETLSQTRREDLSARGGSIGSEPALYVVLEGERVLAGGLRAPLRDIDEIRIGRGPNRSLRIESDRKATLQIPDPRMSSKHARIFREDDAWLLEDVGSTNGTFVEGKRQSHAALEEVTIITLGATCLRFEPAETVPDGVTSVVVDASSLKSRPRGTATLVPIVENAMPRLVRVAMSKLSILLLGESGAGKEVLARTIHTLSGRTGTFVAINCGALAPTLVESQLFGHLKGAFSGATRDEPGIVRSASGGTLFLDEIGELPPSAQATLLRVLQEKEVLPVGGTKPVPVDLRVVAATLKPIDDSATFRADLYARISAFVHRLVPLRERAGDIGLLIADLLPRLAPDRPEIRLAPDLATAIASHDYPLNVRELEHLLSVALVTSTEDLLRLDSVGEALKPKPREADEARSVTPSESKRSESKDKTDTGSHAARSASRPLSEEEQKLKEELTQALQRTNGNVSEISRTMGKTRMQIHRWMKRFGLDPETFRSG
jgi:sigma-54 dependent transcriptional regulator, acetoin dehydrogenase operon transcriptional activator AcoR